MTPISIERSKVDAFRLQLPARGEFNGQQAYSDVVGQTILWRGPDQTLATVFKYIIEFEWKEPANEWVIANPDLFTIVD